MIFILTSKKENEEHEMTRDEFLIEMQDVADRRRTDP